MALKLQKGLEAKVQEQLYTNLHLLTILYPPTEDFQNVFKKDMFAKSNKAAFHHVIHFLLNVLDADTFKIKVPNWPIYEIRQESQFRNEIMKYGNELNSLYEDANIPTIMTSHLISPGGFKFSKFMLKLSQLVLYEHLRKDANISNMFHRIHPDKSKEITETIIKQLDIHTQQNNSRIMDTQLEFSAYLKKSQKEADDIVKQQSAINNQVPLLQAKCISLDSMTYNHLNSPMQEMQLEKTKLIFNIGEKFKKINELSTYFCNDDFCLSYKPVADACEKELDLIQFFEEFNSLLSKKCLEIRTLSDNDVTLNIEKYKGINAELSQLVSYFNCIHKKMMKLMLEVNNDENSGSEVASDLRTNEFTNSFKELKNIDSTILAVPLDDTTEEGLALNIC